MLDGYWTVIPVEEFFSLYMQGDPSSLDSSQIDKIVSKTQVHLTKAAGKIKGNSDEIGFDAFRVSGGLPPNDGQRTRLPPPNHPTFAKTDGAIFKPIHATDHAWPPDVSASLSGQELPQTWEWHHVGTVLECKSHEDPFDDLGNVKSGQLQNIVQLLNKARCILMASGSCYVLVVTVFRNSARLFRIDRSGYIVSHPFDWSVNVRVFPEFYWRLYNGGNEGRILGHDSTVSTPTEAEKKELFEQLRKLPQYASMSFEEATTRNRWVDGKFDGKDRRAFTVGPPIFQSKGLLGWGTRVGRVLIQG
ncbi:hypothetical protein C8R46DRAFT_1255800 [Mycena filopes]|nr:hypothetical protein C8R46DRAFT_1255800 [Mycena filopes]